MQLRYITCSDPREHNSVNSIIDLLKTSPFTEVAIQAHPSKLSFGMPRQVWFEQVLTELHIYNHRLNFAVHVNKEFCEKMINGVLPAELYDAFYLEHASGVPVIKRWQLNMPKSVAENFPTDTVARTIINNPDKEFIFQYNKRNANALDKLKRTGAKFSILFDASGGRGIEASEIHPPFAEHKTGYSGGFSPENISDKLDKIAALSGARNDIWIDAEGKLKNENNQFDVSRAKQYVNNVLSWQQKHR